MTTTLELPQIFDGGTLIELTPAQIKALPEGKEEQYFQIAELWLADREANEHLIDARSNNRAANDDFLRAQAEFSKMSKPTQLEEQRRVILQQNRARLGLPALPPPEIPEEVLALQAEVEALNQAVGVAQSVLYRADQATKVTQAALAKAIDVWMQGGETKEQRVRRVQLEHLERLAEHERNGNVATPQQPNHMSHLDAVLSSGARGHTANYGYRRPTRGHYVRPKLPSQR
jgi:hypothetical protein